MLYVNGLALGVLELKRSTVSVAEGIRQNLDSQKPEFIRPFYATVQLLLAGNETEGLRYGVIETPEKQWLRWKEADALPAAGDNPLLRELGQVCRRERLIEIVHDFVVFDAGVRKTCRHNQYFGVRAAQAHVRRREGGIIWHTQGSGKSLTMVWLARWIRENVPDSRVLVITDRTELDEQIEQVFLGVSEQIHRTASGADLVRVLHEGTEWLMASLIHKFGASDETTARDVDAYVDEVRRSLPPGFRAKGDIFVFVDECHRTQSGKLHEAMTDLLPGAMLIGFTGTPLLKADKRRSIETFGPYIHTYKYDEAVRDGVVLDLRYEARDIDQHLASPARVDQWFDLKTRGLTDVARAQLKQRWGTMRRVLSARDRLAAIVNDILLDMETRDRLRSGRGNALLVSGSIYAACRLFEMFQRTDLAGRCAIVTSYRPAPGDVKGEETGEGLTEKLRQYDIYRRMLADHFGEPEETAMHRAERFEREVKRRFVHEPGRMKLLIVVDKLLTGFDAPPATYLYIDKPMQDHGLFQAICRVNRLDGEDKEYGYVIDYKDLFRSLEQSIHDYTGGAFEGYDAADVQGLLKDRLRQGRERLEEAREAVAALCEPVEPPRDTAAYLRWFCGTESGGAAALAANESKRVALYKLAAAFLRAWSNLANEMREAGYSDAEAQAIKAEVEHYEQVRREVKLASGDYVDMKVYEPAMRHLLDTYVRAGESEKLSELDDLTLVQLIVERGEAAVESLPAGLRGNRDAVAETIENNVRRIILDERAVNPRYYEQMSGLLDALIRQRRQEALDYQAYLAKIVDLTRRIGNPETRSSYPPGIDSGALRALFDNLEALDALAAPRAPAVRERRPRYDDERPAGAADARSRAGAAVAIDRAIRRVKKPTGAATASRSGRFGTPSGRCSATMRTSSTGSSRSSRRSVTTDVTTEGDRRRIDVRGMRVEVVRKDIKHLHLGVYPPQGRVRVAVPAYVDDEAVRLAVIARLGWIRRRQAEFGRQDRQSRRDMVSGESHYVDGRRYRLTVVEQDGPPAVRLRNRTTLELQVRPGTGRDAREAVLYRWYRRRLRDRLPALLAAWEPRVGVPVAEIRIRRMKTRWGTCNPDARRIWLNLELARKPASCLEYIVVHEMVHLLERRHTDRFRELLDGLMPRWRAHRDELNRAPLAHEEWTY